MKILVAVGQMTSGLDKGKNLDSAEEIIDQAARLGAKFLSLPENFAFLGLGDEDALRAAEPLDGPSISRLKKCAQKNRIWLSLGGFQERIEGADKIYNTHLVLDDQGVTVAKYRKMHRFSARLADGTIYDEARSVIAGEEVVCCETPYFTAGLSICYDLRFPELYAAQRMMGAEILLVPAAFTEATGKAHWEPLLRARAIETQCYVLAAAQIGRHNERRATHGHAMIVDPWGAVLAQCGELSHLALAEIDLAYVKILRERMPVFEHRRTITYEPL